MVATDNAAMKSRVAWPAEGVSRAPYVLFSDDEIYELEQQRIFRGPTWNFLGLEAELPESGSFILSHIGDTPIIVVRDKNGDIGAMVNRCAHKGTLLILTKSGKTDQFMCIYHNWCFDLKGDITTRLSERTADAYTAPRL
jgi:anthranilate 1,2-dioxygenase large subunit/terephthalate 1,2-dioxygenase oxygenase component alpha subunit